MKKQYDFSNWNIMVVGAGTMGIGIAETYAAYGCNVSLVDFPGFFDRAKDTIEENLRFVEKENLWTCDMISNVKSNITLLEEGDMSAICPDINLVVECITENPDAKRSLYSKLDKFCSSECIFCSNTSGSNVFEIAQISHPERMIITHWFNPPFVMDLVEIVMGPSTKVEIMETVKQLHIFIGRKPAVIRKYVPGFIVNRIMNVLMKEIGYMIDNGWTDEESIEAAISSTNGVRYAFEGPLKLGDVVGWDLIQTVVPGVLDSLCKDTGNSIPYIDRLVKDGRLGLKSGKGAFDYSDTSANDFMNNRSNKILKMSKTIAAL